MHSYLTLRLMSIKQENDFLQTHDIIFGFFITQNELQQNSKPRNKQQWAVLPPILFLYIIYLFSRSQ